MNSAGWLVAAGLGYLLYKSNKEREKELRQKGAYITGFNYLYQNASRAEREEAKKRIDAVKGA